MEEGNDIIVHPGRGIREKGIPGYGILLVNPTEARHAAKVLLDGGGEQRFLFHSSLVVSAAGDFFVAGPGVGAPMAVMVLEKLISLGAKSVVMTGWCGAIDPSITVGDSIIAGVAHPGEGTSRYYGGEDVYHPSKRLINRMKEVFRDSVSQPFWSTDAPYRESRKMLNELNKQLGVAAVDMEYSALCAVAAFRGIEFASIFLVSDELWQEKWRPGFNGKVFKRKSKALIKQLMNSIVAIATTTED